MSDIKLKPQHQTFALAFIKLQEGAAAYKVAYPKASALTCRNNATKLLKRDDIKQFIDEYQQKLIDDAIMDIKEIQEEITKIIKDPHSSRGIKLKGLDMLAKQLGAYNHVIKTENHNINDDYNNLTDEELDNALSELDDE